MTTPSITEINKTDGEIGQAEAHVLPDRSVGEQLIAFGKDLRKWRKVKRIENVGAGCDFPS